MKGVEILNMYIEACDIHAEHVSYAQDFLGDILPLNLENLRNLSKNQIAHLDQLIYRFTKLQDTIGRKIFPLMLGLLGEEIGDNTFIDKLNKLEKIGALENKQFWQDLRGTRNLISHEYPEEKELILEAINKCMIDATRLLQYWEYLKQFIDKRVMQSL